MPDERRERLEDDPVAQPATLSQADGHGPSETGEPTLAGS
jgi:hypothetical protein